MLVSELLERDDALTELHTALSRARTGTGSIALVNGEAGAGKSSLVLEFIRQAAGPPVVVRGACDPLAVPRPLGPLIDAAGEIDPAAANRLTAGATRVEAFAIALGLVDGTRSSGRPTVFVIEDAHWADDATLDLITFLGRRITELPTLLVITYRDDEVGVNHPLRARLGELASAIRSRVHLAGLSTSAVAQLAEGSTIDPVALQRMTGGNAFYVTEMLATGADVLPDSIREVVLARAARLPPGARRVLDAAAIVPGRVERWLLDAIVGDADAVGAGGDGGDGGDGGAVSGGLDICIERGLLHADIGATTAFRHELARLAILEGLTATQRRGFHRRAGAALRMPPGNKPDATRIAFHAAEAGDVNAVLQYAPIAAAQAASVGAHREAVEHLENALRHRDHTPLQQQAALLVSLGTELTNIGRFETTVDTFDEAARISRELGDEEGDVEAAVASTRALVLLGRQPEAIERIHDVMARVGPAPRGRSSALIAARLSGMHMLARQLDDAEREGRRAIDLAEESGYDDILAEVLIQSGAALAVSGDVAGLTRIRRGIDIATRLGNDELVTLGHTQIGSGYGEMRRYDIAVPALMEGVAFGEAREHVASVFYMNAWLARCELELGRWNEASARAGALSRSPRCVGISRFVALVTLGWLRGRRADPDVDVLLDETLVLARATGHVQRLWPVAACRAEVAWLGDRLDDERELLDEAMAAAVALSYAPAIEELAHWQRIADGRPRGSADAASTPFGLSASGRPDLAIARWSQIGCPYEEAMARYFTGDVSELTAAHRAFDALGAVPMRTRAGTALREAGAAVPRRPLPTTRENPHLLTDRELDVLRLLAEGKTNREIADELYISVKTVGHHVSHVLAKLEVRSRSEAAVAAARLGLTAPK